jgi:S-adenosyl methyltransferase
MLMELYPPLPALARENRAFLVKAVGWAARQGSGGFIDLGAGLPASPAGPPGRAGGPARAACAPT